MFFPRESQFANHWHHTRFTKPQTLAVLITVHIVIGNWKSRTWRRSERMVVPTCSSCTHYQGQKKTHDISTCGWDNMYRTIQLFTRISNFILLSLAVPTKPHSCEFSTPKWAVHPKTYSSKPVCLFFVEQKRRYFEECSRPYNESHWGPKQLPTF